MKKSLSILCVVALLIGLMIPVSAASLTFTVGTVTDVTPGAAVEVPVSVSNNPGIYATALSISYDSKLTATGVTQVKTGLAKMAMTGGNDMSVNPFTVTFDNTDPDNTNGQFLTLKFTAPSEAGTYNISLTVDSDNTFDADWGNITDAIVEAGSITVKGSDPTPVAKTVTYTAANGTVMASTVALAAPAEAKASGTIKTAGTAAEEEVYFYFFPNKGYTTDGMTVNGEAVIGAAGSKKYTVTADATYDFVFKKIEDAAAIAAKPTGAISGTPAAASLTTFATAAGASEFGILIGAADAWGADITADYAAASETGKIRKYAALEANGEGQFAIELNDTAKNFLKNGTYKAYIYAANGSNVTFGDAIDIAIAE